MAKFFGGFLDGNVLVFGARVLILGAELGDFRCEDGCN